MKNIIKDVSKMTAKEIVKDMKIGWNLGNSLEAACPDNKETATIAEFEMNWGNPQTTKEMILEIINAGFNTIRVPVTWWKKLDVSSDYKIDPQWLDRVQEVVDYIYNEGIYVILNTHHEDDWLSPIFDDLDRRVEILEKIWLQICERFKDYDNHLIFETMNEVRLIGTEYEWNSGTPDARKVINILNNAAVTAIRSTGGNNKGRAVIIPTYGARAAADAIDDIIVPDNDNMIILSVHAYAPYPFCMVPDETAFWGSEEDKKELVDLLDSISNVAKMKDLPMIIGEFGTINKKNQDIRAEYLEFYIREALKREITCILWDNNECNEFEWNSFGLFNREKLSWRFPNIFGAIMNPFYPTCLPGHSLKEKNSFNDKVLRSVPFEFYGSNLYDERETKAVSEVIKAKAPFRYYRLTDNHITDKFEDMCKKYFGVDYVHCVNSGMGALSCAMHSFEVGIGDEVIVPGYLFLADINAILLRGAVPVLCEVDDSFGINPEDLKSKITDKTKCVVLIHMDGGFGKVNEVINICKERNIKVLEDFSQAIGASINGRKLGSFGDIAIASFQQNKMITAGEGGIILTNNKKYYKKCRLRSDVGLDRALLEDEDVKDLWTYGEGRRFSEISAAIMMVQLSKLDEMVLHINKSKQFIVKTLGDILPVRFREVPDPDGEVGSILTMIFESVKQASDFWDYYKNQDSEGVLRLIRLEDTGLHIYYNCTNLVNKIESLPNNFPWMYYDDKKYSYHKGTLPYTDELLEKSIIIKIPAGLTDLQKNVMADSLKNMIGSFLYKNN